MAQYGLMYSFSNTVITFNGVPLTTATNITYDPNRPYTQVIGSLGIVTGIVEGSEAPTASITMKKDEWISILRSSPTKTIKGLNGTRGFDILVTHLNEQPTTDRIVGCFINGAPVTVGEGDNGIEVQLDLTVTSVLYDV